MPDNFTTYFPRVLKQVHEGPSLLQEAVGVMDSFVKDIFEHIADKASRLACSTKHTTITSRKIQTVVHVLLPGEIGKCAVSQTSKAVIRSSLCLIQQQIKCRSRCKNTSEFFRPDIKEIFKEAGYSSQKISPTLSQQIIFQRMCQGCKKT
ncbi:histone H2B type F-M-like [Mustela erminea]|uniref:histone H2B type F-M-like n=1 Tax=Mustela erminea TaxID=36723 RepID=UPI001386A588|nr:histone H2B type F-M-like [Mustela erminea]